MAQMHAWFAEALSAFRPALSDGSQRRVLRAVVVVVGNHEIIRRIHVVRHGHLLCDWGPRRVSSWATLHATSAQHHTATHKQNGSWTALADRLWSECLAKRASQKPPRQPKHRGIKALTSNAGAKTGRGDSAIENTGH